MALPNGWSSIQSRQYSSVFHDLKYRSIFGSDEVQAKLSNSTKGMQNHIFKGKKAKLIKTSNIYVNQCKSKYGNSFRHIVTSQRSFYCK